MWLSGLGWCWANQKNNMSSENAFMCWKSKKYPNHFNQTNFQPTQLTVPRGLQDGDFPIILWGIPQHRSDFVSCHIQKLQMSWFHVPTKWKCDAPYKTPGIHLSGSMYQGEKVIQGIGMRKNLQGTFFVLLFSPSHYVTMFLGVLDQHKFQHNQHLTINSWCRSSGRCQDTGAEIVPNQYPQDVTNAKRPTWIERRRRPKNGGVESRKDMGLDASKSMPSFHHEEVLFVCVCVF